MLINQSNTSRIMDELTTIYLTQTFNYRELEGSRTSPDSYDSIPMVTVLVTMVTVIVTMVIVTDNMITVAT